MSGGTITAINALIDGSGDSMSGGTIYAPTKFSTPGSYYGSGVTVVSGTVTNTIGNIVSFGGTFYGNLAGGTNLPAAGVTNAAGFWAAMPAPTLTYSNITALGTNAYSISGGVVVDDDRSLVATNDPRSITLPNLTATVETWGTNNFTMNQYGPNEYDLRYDGTNLMQLFGHSTPLAVSLPSASLSVSNNITLAGGGSAVNGVGFTNGVIAGAMNASNITGTINATIIGTPTFNGQNITNMSATNVSGTFGSISTSGSLSVGGTITGNANGLTNLPWGTGYSVSLLGASISTNVAGVSKWFTMNGTILSSPSTSGIFVATPLQPGTYGMFKAFLSPTITMAATTNITMLFCTNSWGNGVPVSTGVTFTWSGPIASYSVSGSLYQTNYATTISVQDGSYGCWLITNNATASQVANGAVQAIISASMLFHQ